MPTVTVSSKHQITLPAEIVRELGLKAGDKLAIELLDGHIVALPEPESWVDYFFGSEKGVYGETTEEIDRYVAEERASWWRDDPREWREQFHDLMAIYEEARKIVQALQAAQGHTANERDILSRTGLSTKEFKAALNKLVPPRYVRELPILDSQGQRVDMKYRLVQELAERSAA